jgi:hypothetical protein
VTQGPRCWFFLFLVGGLLSLTACSMGYRVQTHPDPDARLGAMRKTLESLPNQPQAPAENPEPELKGKQKEQR